MNKKDMPKRETNAKIHKRPDGPQSKMTKDVNEEKEPVKDELEDAFSQEAVPRKKKKPSANSRRARRARARRRRRAKRIFYGTVSAVLGVVCALILGFCTISIMRYSQFREMRAYLDTDAFYPGMKVDGMDLGGYTLSDALDEFQSREVDYAQKQAITFVSGNEEYLYGAEKLGFESNYAAVVKGAWNVGRKGTIAQRYAAAQAGCDYTISRGYSDDTLRQATDALAQSLTKDCVNAQIEDFVYNRGEFVFSKEETGIYVDPEELYQSTVSALAQGTTSVEIRQVESQPSVTAEMLSTQYGELSSAVTNASSSNSNRINNIRLACAAINEMCMQPGEEFSFNGVVGKRTSEAGYKKAGVYVSGELGEEIGGGICQVSTTLFNAVVKADLEVTERHNHSLPVAYVDNGKDATVSWGVQDLKFVNSSDEPIYIVAFVTEDKRVRVHIFGKLRTDGLTVSLVPVLQETIKPGDDEYQYTGEIPTGTTRVKSKARNGYRVNTYKAYTDADGNVVDKVFLCSSYYPARAAVIEIGK